MTILNIHNEIAISKNQRLEVASVGTRFQNLGWKSPLPRSGWDFVSEGGISISCNTKSQLFSTRFSLIQVQDITAPDFKTCWFLEKSMGIALPYVNTEGSFGHQQQWFVPISIFHDVLF